METFESNNVPEIYGETERERADRRALQAQELASEESRQSNAIAAFLEQRRAKASKASLSRKTRAGRNTAGKLATVDAKGRSLECKLHGLQRWSEGPSPYPVCINAFHRDFAFETLEDLAAWDRERHAVRTHGRKLSGSRWAGIGLEHPEAGSARAIMASRVLNPLDALIYAEELGISPMELL